MTVVVVVAMVVGMVVRTDLRLDLGALDGREGADCWVAALKGCCEEGEEEEALLALWAVVAALLAAARRRDEVGSRWSEVTIEDLRNQPKQRGHDSLLFEL